MSYFALLTWVAIVTGYAPESSNGLTRWTEVRPVVGRTAACPVEWAMLWIWVEGYGERLCEDTPRTGWYAADEPHVDLFFPNAKAAFRHGIVSLTVIVCGELPCSAQVAPASVPVPAVQREPYCPESVREALLGGRRCAPQLERNRLYESVT